MILVCNAGSSSCKFGLYDDDANETATGEIDWKVDPHAAELVIERAGNAPQKSQHEVRDFHAAVAVALEALVGKAERAQVRAVGQRVVHGGAKLTKSVRIDDEVRREIERMVAVAPLHNPPALQAIDAVGKALPDVPQVAVFDTAFYAGLAPEHYVFPVPYAWFSEWGVRRFGFHGISHGYCAGRARELYGGRQDARIVSCHLGNGCSITATRGERAVATTMGFTPIDGLMMGTRAGAVDPGVLLYVQEQRGLDARAVDEALNHDSGLKGVSGVSSDYREVERAAAEGDARARLALDIYAVRVRQAIGAMAVTLGGVDALVFTAGVGEHSAALRRAACEGLACIGVQLDARANDGGHGDRDVATSTSGARVLVLHTREELVIARETKRAIA
ncbi:MAG TPA: acetate/propionate family kinase [Polyangia bacterium]|jgi:acetate kinase|nr:acetate/propionate family kinase [Polyangia bacterium]